MSGILSVIRWGWRLFRREWRQQLLVLGLLTIAVAATIWGASVVTNTQLPPAYPTFGAGAARVTLPGADPHLAADIAAIAGRWGPADLIEEQNIATGARQSAQLRAESPHGHYNSPLLGLVSGAYPAGPGQVALTSEIASRYGAHAGGAWHAGGATWPAGRSGRAGTQRTGDPAQARVVRRRRRGARTGPAGPSWARPGRSCHSRGPA
jgi:putative ABC transport system permease protein